MKLERLHLKAFGPFDDHTLNFSEGNYGFHLVYGPNEAGKSTTLRAITQLFYGIAARTTDAFYHPQNTLRIGATLANERGSLTFYRRKGNKGTLLGEDNKSELDDDALRPFLGGVDEETFTHLFGLSHEQLVRGGEALVQGEGDVGQALFSAAAGLGNLKGVLERLDGEAGELFKPSGSKPAINAGLKALKETRQKMKSAQVLPKAWAERAKSLEETRRERDALAASLKAGMAEQSRLQRILLGLPLVSQRLELLGRLAEVEDAARLPEDFRERRVAAQERLGTAREQHQAAEANLERLRAQLDGLDVDEALLAQESRIDSLRGRHEVNRKALEDCRRELEPALRQRRAEVARLLRDLRCDADDNNLEALRPEPGVSRRIPELVNARLAIDKDGTHARSAQTKLIAEQKRHGKTLAELGDVPDTAALDQAIKTARPVAAAEGEQEARAATVKRLRARIDDALARLALGGVAHDELERLSVPGASAIERMRLQMDSDEAEVRRWEEERRTLESERDEVVLQIDTFQRAQNVPTEAALAEGREAWEAGILPGDVAGEGARELLEAAAAHGKALNLADAVEVLTDRADETADRLRRESDRAAHVAQLESRRIAVGEKLARLEETVAAGTVRHGETQSEWVALWAAANLTPKRPVEMAEWRAEYGEALADRGRLKEEEDRLHTYATRAEAQREKLRAALADFGGATGMAGALPEMLAAAESALEAARERRQARTQAESRLAEVEAELEACGQDLARIAEAERAWASDWAAMMGRIGSRPDASPAEATEKLALLHALFSALDAAADLEARIAQIEGDNEAYLASVDELAHAVGPAVECPAEELVPALVQALKTQQRQANEQANLSKRLSEEEERLSDARAALDGADRELAELCALAGVADAQALEAAEARARTREGLTAELRALETRLLDHSPGLPLEAFLELIASEDPDAAAARVHDLGPELESLEGRREGLSEEIGELERDLKALDGSGEAAALADESQTLLAQLAEDARHYARLRVAHFVLDEAIERYRAANQEPLLARASAIFSTLTLGSFRELCADYDSKGNHVLCGLRDGGDTPVHVPGMSEGTADQLYLALRLASLERHLERHAPIPLVLDDILVNFDDHRAAATLKVLGDLSDRTQIIYFTHHAHLVELAKAHVGKKQLFTHALAR